MASSLAENTDKDVASITNIELIAEQINELQIKQPLTSSNTSHFLSPNVIPFPKPLNICNGDIMENFDLFKLQWNNYLIASGISDTTEVIKISTLLTAIGDDFLKLYQKSPLVRENWETEKDLLNAIGVCIMPVLNIREERWKFNKAIQEHSETYDAYFKRLRNLIKTCKYGIKEEDFLLDKIIYSIKDCQLRNVLWTNKGITLQDSIDICKKMEQSDIELRNMALENENETNSSKNRRRNRRHGSGENSQKGLNINVNQNIPKLMDLHLPSNDNSQFGAPTAQSRSQFKSHPYRGSPATQQHHNRQHERGQFNNHYQQNRQPNNNQQYQQRHHQRHQQWTQQRQSNQFNSKQHPLLDLPETENIGNNYTNDRTPLPVYNSQYTMPPPSYTVPPQYSAPPPSYDQINLNVPTSPIEISDAKPSEPKPNQTVEAKPAIKPKMVTELTSNITSVQATQSSSSSNSSNDPSVSGDLIFLILLILK